MTKKIKYYLNQENEFVIENYNLASPFSNFLPGIAGLFGIPMWVFYTNRGQGICSFGVRSKDNPIMEFLPANRAYQLASSQGFRTFIKIKSRDKSMLYEPFRPHPDNGHITCDQEMRITPHELRMSERAPKPGIEVEVRYFTVPNEPYAALARELIIKNVSRKTVKMEVLDGNPIMVPYGVNNFFMQKMRRTIEAWMIVENTRKDAPFFRLKVDPRDVSEVVFIKEGNFYTASMSKGKKHLGRLRVIVDPSVVFGQSNDFIYPVKFMEEKKFKIPSRQTEANKLPCAFSYCDTSVKPGESLTVHSILGHMSSKEKLNSHLAKIGEKKFFGQKREDNRSIINELTDNAFTSSGSKKYDLYCRQTFLDNVMRGGYPLHCNADSHNFYIYSRKHGDPERDYNYFYIDPTYFSQGNGNFRDMNQNRRNDVFFKPEIDDSNIFNFYNLVQLDGYNPLVIMGAKFRLKKGINRDDKVFLKLKEMLSEGFTPGHLFMSMEEMGIKIKKPWHKFLSDILKDCETVFRADHEEGYWIDHWTYNLDLVESYLSVYPERLKTVLLEKKEFTFYDNSHRVKPRSERYILKKDGTVRQYHSLTRDSKKDHIIKQRSVDRHIMRSRKGEGPVYKTSLLVKLLCLTANKIATLDPSGIGIEMEADKPGWCDSMNGLPGLIGSSTPEVFELKRQMVFMKNSLELLYGRGTDFKINLPVELYEFLKAVESVIKKEKKISAKKRDYYYWDKTNTAKEKYREITRLGVNGSEKHLSLKDTINLLKLYIRKIDGAIKKAYIPSRKIYATYFINKVTKFRKTDKKDRRKDLPLIWPLAFKSHRMPLFLEGVVRSFKVEKDIKKKKSLYKALRKTDIYDKKLRMYKINESLKNESREVGRSSVFTPGWLENESVWLHMEYKYLLEILKAGMYKEFFDEFKTVLVAFQDPEVYGRSILENSSFIVSSEFPDPEMHGKGFVARLSGSTAEMMNIWITMNVGYKPFYIDQEANLALRFDPILPSFLFSRQARNGFPKNSYAFRFLGYTTVVYHNPRLKNTAGSDSVNPRFMTLRYKDGQKAELKRNTIPHPYSRDIREGKVDRIDIYLG